MTALDDAIAAATLSELMQDCDALYRAVGQRAPRLELVTVTDDGETYQALRCPTCGELVDAEEFRAVDSAERWASVDGSIDPAERVVRFDSDSDRGDYGDTFFYLHLGATHHPVNLPDGWEEDWS